MSRRQSLARHERRAVHLGDDRSTVGQIEPDDAPDPGFVELGGDDRHPEDGGDGLGERFRHRHGGGGGHDRPTRYLSRCGSTRSARPHTAGSTEVTMVRAFKRSSDS